MGLDSLLKARHKSSDDSPSLIPSIEEHLLRKAQVDEETWFDKQTRFHPSSVCYWGVCSRQYYIINNREKLGIDVSPPDPHESSLLRIFEHGHSIHSLYQDNLLGPAGVLYGKWKLNEQITLGFQPSPEWEYVEPRIFWTDYKLSGYCDGIVEIGDEWFVLEIKSTNDNSFRFIKSQGKPQAYHARQALLYCEAPMDIDVPGEIKGCIVLYVNKNTGAEMDFFVERDTVSVQKVLDQMSDALVDLSQDELPPKVSDCLTKGKRAKDCPVCNQCFALSNPS